MKLRPTIDQTETFTYNVAKVIPHYLRSSCKNQYYITNTLQFPNMLPSIPPSQGDKEDVSYDVESLLQMFR